MALYKFRIIIIIIIIIINIMGGPNSKLLSRIIIKLY